MEGKREREAFLFPTQELGAKTQNGGSQLLVLYWRAGRIYVIKDNGSGWLGWLSGSGHPPKSHPINPHPTQVTETTGVL
jgi:hypothetical protein